MENKKKEEIGQGTAMTKEDFAALWKSIRLKVTDTYEAVSYTHLRAHETDSYLVCRLLLEKKKN